MQSSCKHMSSNAARHMQVVSWLVHPCVLRAFVDIREGMISCQDKLGSSPSGVPLLKQLPPNTIPYRLDDAVNFSGLLYSTTAFGLEERGETGQPLQSYYRHF
jgi:hypothetical protein